MRAILPRLEKMSAAQVLNTLRSNLASLEGDEGQAILSATMAFVQQSLPERLRPLLVPLGMHEGFVDAGYLEMMAKQVDAGWSRYHIDALVQALVAAGLLREIAAATYEMHPMLTSFLRSAHLNDAAIATRNQWAQAFVDVIGTLANKLAPRELHEQRMPFHFHAQNFRYALAEAERLKMLVNAATLTQSLAAFAQNSRNFAVATPLFVRLAKYGKEASSPEMEASAYHQLGMIAQEQRDFGSAEQWYRKSLAISEREGNAHASASTHHQLGMVAQEQRDFGSAERWYRESLAINEKQGNAHGIALTYQQLGSIARELRDFAGAKQWYRKSLAIVEKQGDEHGTAGTYHQLGRIAEEQQDFAAAEQWYRKSLAIVEKQGDEHGAAGTYHQLGRVAEEQQDFAAAEQWYRKSLAIEEKHGNEHGAAITYHQLGMIAQEQRNFGTAEQWYLKSLAIKERQGDENGAARTYAELGLLAELQGQFVQAGQWMLKAITVFRRDDFGHSAVAIRQFSRIHQGASSSQRTILKGLWAEAGLGALPEADEAARHSATKIIVKRWWEWLTGVGRDEVPPDLPTTVSMSFEALRVRLRNIRVFHDTSTIELRRREVLIVGENAAGKSTFLRCIALAALGPELANQIERRPASYLRHNAEKGFIEVLFRLDSDSDNMIGEFCVGLEIRSGETSFRAMNAEDITLGRSNCALRLDVVRRRAQDDFGFLCAYGPLRTFADPSSLLPAHDKETLDRVGSLFDPHAPVVDPDLLAKLLSGDLTNFRNAPASVPESTLHLMQGHIRSLLPNCGELVNGSSTEIPLYGDTVPLRDLSDGYSSLLALIGHLFRYSLVGSHWSGDPAKVRGVALIDEIDAHLHPAWQRSILPDLSMVFRNLQIIATTHSPMVEGSVDAKFIRIFKRDGASVNVVETPTSIEGWRADQILTSILFDLPTTRSQQVEALFLRYADSLAKFGPEHPEVQQLGPRVAKALEIEAEGKVDRTTHELLDQLILERFQNLDDESRKLVIAKAGLVAGRRKWDE